MDHSSTLPKFAKGQYIVIKPTAQDFNAFKRNYIYKQRELDRILKPEVCSIGATMNSSAVFTADDNSNWRLASASEIVLYNNNGGPCDSTEIGFDIELETAERILLREDFCVNVPEELHGTYVHFAHELSVAVGEEYVHLSSYFLYQSPEDRYIGINDECPEIGSSGWSANWLSLDQFTDFVKLIINNKSNDTKNKSKSKSVESSRIAESITGRKRPDFNVEELGRRGEGLEKSDRRRRKRSLSFISPGRRSGYGLHSETRRNRDFT